MVTPGANPGGFGVWNPIRSPIAEGIAGVFVALLAVALVGLGVELLVVGLWAVGGSSLAIGLAVGVGRIRAGRRARARRGDEA